MALTVDDGGPAILQLSVGAKDFVAGTCAYTMHEQ